MALGSGPNEEDIIADINMTPLIDIMLVLLIIFMVTSSISLESGLDINVPKTSTQTGQVAETPVIVSLSKDGTLAVGGKVLSREELTEGLKSALAAGKTTQVILEGDAASSLGSAIEIMDLAKAAGAEKFSIAAEQEKP